MGTEEIKELYVALGVGGLSFVSLVWILVFVITKINPTLQKIKEDNASHKEVIKNNTDAIREVSKSNDNIATALQLLDLSLKALVTSQERHDQRTEIIEREVLKIRENTRR